jgi:hypothetical protein
MRPLGAVVGRVGAEHVLEVSAAEDQQPVETLGACAISTLTTSERATATA